MNLLLVLQCYLIYEYLKCHQYLLLYFLYNIIINKYLLKKVKSIHFEFCELKFLYFRKENNMKKKKTSSNKDLNAKIENHKDIKIKVILDEMIKKVNQNIIGFLSFSIVISVISFILLFNTYYEKKILIGLLYSIAFIIIIFCGLYFLFCFIFLVIFGAKKGNVPCLAISLIIALLIISVYIMLFIFVINLTFNSYLGLSKEVYITTSVSVWTLFAAVIIPTYISLSANKKAEEIAKKNQKDNEKMIEDNKKFTLANNKAQIILQSKPLLYYKIRISSKRNFSLNTSQTVERNSINDGSIYTNDFVLLATSPLNRPILNFELKSNDELLVIKKNFKTFDSNLLVTKSLITLDNDFACVLDFSAWIKKTYKSEEKQKQFTISCMMQDINYNNYKQMISIIIKFVDHIYFVETSEIGKIMYIED